MDYLSSLCGIVTSSEKGHEHSDCSPEQSDQSREQTDQTPEQKHIRECIDALDDFDIILFNGQGFWFSYVVEYFTWSKFSHIGIVLKSPTWLDSSLTGNYLLESGTENRKDAENHRIKFGVQIQELEPILEGYTGRAWYRKLQSIPLRNCPETYQQKLRRLHAIIHNKPYDDSPLDLLEVELGESLNNARRTNDFFCSALVAFIFSQLGFMLPETEWDLYQPEAFNKDGKAEENMQKQGMALLEGLVRIK